MCIRSPIPSPTRTKGFIYALWISFCSFVNFKILGFRNFTYHFFLISHKDELATQATQGTIHPEGRSDLFALAYEEPEHPGRVRVGGKFQTITSFLRRIEEEDRLVPLLLIFSS
ncbi:hypothetical protein AXF42_Ash006272 [Apostasia shenzhenica]|uniref:Uncharacterized protein n=1 Tax=Apostasia shenzhenica TaxID=1088818 RepID=A0A2I0AYM6_9ASPA|nr:hypothetical protein AXF42_Ash006272 [Apostasia shenzhenica]